MNMEHSLKKKVVICLALLLGTFGCPDKEVDETPLFVPRGFVSVLEINTAGDLVRFGPFVGYYFCPPRPDDLGTLEFVCFNERSFYTKDIPGNVRLFEGQAVAASLPSETVPKPVPGKRMQPVFSGQIPDAWLETRPQPQDEFTHFHSCYDANGPVHHGYWLRHIALTSFTYDMGSKVGPESPLYHQVRPGVDKQFPRIVEFDKGPAHSNG
jgi:hypothetical protein